jgi:hypothetical protein
MKKKQASRLLHEAGFQADGDAVHLAGDFVVAVHQADRFALRAGFSTCVFPSVWNSLCRIYNTERTHLSFRFSK